MANKYAQFSKRKDATRQLHRRIHTRSFRMCAKKRSFKTDKQAVTFLKDNGYDGRPYLCPECHRWHNTSKPKMQVSA